MLEKNSGIHYNLKNALAMGIHGKSVGCVLDPGASISFEVRGGMKAAIDRYSRTFLGLCPMSL